MAFIGSRHSARLRRFGLLMARDGRWGDRGPAGGWGARDRAAIGAVVHGKLYPDYPMGYGYCGGASAAGPRSPVRACSAT
jgi:hypothetical protein